MNISDFSVVLLDDPRHPDTFQLTDDIKGTVFAFNVSFLVFGGFKIINDIYNLCQACFHLFSVSKM